MLKTLVARLMKHRNCHKHLKGVKHFYPLRKELKRTEGDVKSLLVFHGTPQQNTMSILRDNFDLSKRVNGRKYGDGVYFSEQPEVSIGYTFHFFAFDF